MTHTALTVAGSDPSGGAGIQADLKTFGRLKVYGMSVITALTVQNTMGVTGVFEVPADVIASQWDAVMTDIPVDAMKTGMLANAAAVEVVADKIQKSGVQKVVTDPVLVSTSGTPLLRGDAIEVFKRVLAPLALIITPNLEEAAVLTGHPVNDKAAMKEAARRLKDLGPRWVLVKGGHLEGDALDLLFDGQSFTYFSVARIDSNDVHGTGCVFSAAITAYLAGGHAVQDAVRMGKEFVTAAIRGGLRIGNGRGPCDAGGLNSG